MSGHIKFAFCLAILILSGICSQAHARIWIDSEGRSVDAEFISFDGANVFLRRPSGETLEVAFSKFSDSDKKRIVVLRDQALKTASDPTVAGMTDDKDASDTPTEAEVRRELSRSRKWTDKDGNQIQAKFVRIFEGNVILLQGNKGHNVEFYELCEVDQAYLRDQMEILGQGYLVPPVVVSSFNSSGVAGANVPGSSAVTNGMVPGSMPGSMPRPLGPGGMPGPNYGQPGGVAGMNSTPSPTPINPNETEQERRIREYNEKFAKSSLAGNNSASSNPSNSTAGMVASNTPASSSTPAYDPWSNQPAKHGSMNSSGPPSNTRPPSINTRPPSMPSNPIASQPPSNPMPHINANMPGSDEHVWECKTCHTQFDTVEKPSFCHFCWSLRIGAFVLLSIVGAAIKGAMS